MNTADERFDTAAPAPGKWASIGLSLFMHAVLIAVLFFGIRWQSKPQEPVEVDLYRALPAAPAREEPKPAPPPPPEPKPLPKVEPKPEPAPPPPKPDIAVKEKEKPKLKEPPPKTQAPSAADELQKLQRDQMAREMAQIEKQKAAQELAQVSAKQQASAAARAQAAWAERVAGKIRGNLVVPPEAKGNPVAEVDIALLPTCDVMETSIRIRKSTGFPALDAAIERAVLKSSPLPKPDTGACERNPHLVFRPLEGRP